MMTKSCLPALLLLCALFFTTAAENAPASEPVPESGPDYNAVSAAPPSSGLPGDIENQWGGHFKTSGTASFRDDRTLLGAIRDNPYYDGNVNFRFKDRLFLSDALMFETHYEAVMSGGNTRKEAGEIAKLLPQPADESMLTYKSPMNDDRRLFDLTSVIHESDDYIIYHRLDRLFLSFTPEWGTVRLGRQALTWGNGLVFNPMDLFNPFSPTDIDRDYKVGDDMLYAGFDTRSFGDFQLLLVPRRNPKTGNVESDQSSLAGKVHLASGTTEFDIMLARHYDENTVGLGTRGYVKDAAWRLDMVWASLKGSENESRKDNGCFSLVANMDYSWGWLGKNMYGLIEFYYNSLGHTGRYADAFRDADLMEKIARGEIFTLGRAYLTGRINAELTPLLNAYLTVINNMNDPSGVIQPWIVWDMHQDIQLTFGANCCYGGSETEYGGFEIPNSGFYSAPPDSVFMWVTCYF